MKTLPSESDTPRTESFALAIHEGKCLNTCNSFAHDDKCPVCNGEYLLADFARTLERALNESTKVLELIAQNIGSTHAADKAKEALAHIQSILNDEKGKDSK